MKTTIEIEDELFVAAKKRAAELHRSLRSLIEDALGAELDRLRSRKRRRKIRWVTVDGGLPPVLEVSNREKMWEWFGKQR